MNRGTMQNKLAETPQWDMLVIGGGASGLGVAVDASARGYRTLLVEAHDFAKGTSSRSTKLVHGGVRYLEQGDIPLVLEALRERGLLHQNAPHVVRNLSFIVPRYQWWEGPFYGIGLKMYDALAGRLNLAPSRLLNREETLERIPNIEPEKLLGGVEYFDGQFDDARLAIVLARTAAEHDACLLNHTRVLELTQVDGITNGAIIEDVFTGEHHTVRAKVVVNATGIFTDTIRRMEKSDLPPVVQASQGVHLVFDRNWLPGDSALMVPHTDDGRVLFVIPWHDRVLVGTTDTPMDHADVEPRALEEEIAFILRNAGRYLARDPGIEDVLSIFAGQRPLVRKPGRDGAPTKSISRNHEVLVSDGGLVSLVGGKWTTYRKMAQDAVDHAALLGGLDEIPCPTEHLKLHGWCAAAPAGKPEWLAWYGTDAAEMEALHLEEPAWATLIHERLPYTKAAVIWAVRYEMACTLEDVLARRVRALFLDARATLEATDAVADCMANELGWSPDEKAAAVAEFRSIATSYVASVK